MPEKENTSPRAIASRKRIELARKLGLPVPDPSWGEFRKLQAQHVFVRKLKGHAQHIAMVLATLTDEDGIRFVTHAKLAELTDRPPNSIGKALKEVMAAGYLAGKRTRDGHLYVWLEPAFRGISAAERSAERRMNIFRPFS